MKPLGITPDKIVFRDCEINETDSVNLWVRNQSGKPTQLRFQLPENSPFSISLNRTGIIPYGLETKITIKYKALKNQITKDTMTIIYQDGKIEVPIIAFPKAPCISLSNTYFDLGDISIKSQITKVVKMKNFGSEPSSYSLETEGDFIRFFNNKGVIEPGCETDIGFQVVPKTTGHIEADIKINTQGSLDIVPNITVKANIVETSLKFLYEGKPISVVEFGHVFVGQKKVIQVEVYNPEDTKRSFVIQKANDIKSTGNKMDGSVITSIPSEGIVQPKSSIVVSFVFCPLIQTFDSDVECFYSLISQVEVIETAIPMELKFEGISVGLFYEMSPIDFIFNKQIVSTDVEKELCITNCSQYLPITYSLENKMEFKFKPQTGVIQPKQSKTIKVIFSPRKLGIFDTTHHVVICDIAKKSLNLHGEAVSSNLDGTKFERIPVWKTNPDVIFTMKHPDIRYGLSEEEITKKENLKNEFLEYIRNNAEKREEMRTKSKLIERATLHAKEFYSNTMDYDNDDIAEYVKKELRDLERNDIHIEFGEGLNEPYPVKAGGSSQLPISDPARFELIGQKIKSSVASTGRAHRPHFRTKPSTPPEINECSRHLTPAQQLLVLMSNTTIDFGTVTVLTRETRLFTISNNLQQHIFVEFSFDIAEISDSTPSSQVIPPLQTASFDIVFSAKETINFMRPIIFTINKQHKYELTICANATPIETKLSKSVIEFKFAYDSIDPVVTNSVTMYNNSNAPAEYTWLGFCGVFSVEKTTGVIPPLKSEQVYITYSPLSEPHSELDVTMSVVGGGTKSLKLIGDTGTPQITTYTNIVDFGLIPLSIEKVAYFKVKNRGIDDAIYSLVHSDHYNITINPQNGRIFSGEIKIITFSLQCNDPGDFSYPVTLNICGANPINLLVTGSAQLPNVVIDCEDLSFGKLYIGSSSSKTIVIKNLGKIAAILDIDLCGFDSFHIEYSAELGQCSSSDNENSIQLEQSRFGKKYKICVMQDSQIEFNLIFKPRNIEEHNFELPITIFQNSEGLNRPIVSGISLHTPLLPSTSVIDFGVSPLYDPINPNSRPSVREITLKNEYCKQIQYRFDITNLDPMVQFDSPSGVIEYLQSTSVFVTFRPPHSFPFNQQIALFATTDVEESLVSNISISGIGSPRLFKCSVDFVCLPIVPVGVTSSLTVKIENICFIQSSLEVHLPINTDNNNFPLNIEFPEGNKLSHLVQSIPLKISFVSSKPVSFSTIVALIDEFGHSCSFQVAVTVDNSVFTLFPFMNVNDYDIVLTNHQPPTLTSKTENPDFFSRMHTVGDSLNLTSLTSDVAPETIDFVKRFLNANVLNTQLQEFPQDIAIDSSLFSELIINFGGKKLPTTVSKLVADPLSRRIEEIKIFIQYLKSLGCHLSVITPEMLLPRDLFFQFMRKKVTRFLFGIDYFGAPELSSFSKDVVATFSSSQSFTNSLLERINVYESTYQFISESAWTFVVMQMIKLFYVNRIDPSKFNSIPGVKDATNKLKAELHPQHFHKLNSFHRPTLSSNCYSNQEAILLKWISTFIMNRSAIEPKLILDFLELQDQSNICSLIKQHLILSDPTDFKSAIHALRDQKVCLGINPIDLSKGSVEILAVIAAQLYYALPQCLPSGQLDFRCNLNERVQRSISILNPSQRDISYTAIIEGSSHFSLPCANIVVPPQSSVDFVVEYFAKNHKKQSALLRLIPERAKVPLNVLSAVTSRKTTPTSSRSPRIQRPTLSRSKLSTYSTSSVSSMIPQQQLPPVFSSPIVYDLFSNSIKPVISSKMTVKTELYEPCKANLEIKNVCCHKGNFSVYTRCLHYTDQKDFDNVGILKKELETFIKDPIVHNSIEDSKDAFTNLLVNHKPIIVGASDIRFGSEKETELRDIEIDFIPIMVGFYRCLILFRDDTAEFIHSVEAISELPKHKELNIVIKAECKVNKTDQLTFDQVNCDIYKALAYSIERLASLNNHVVDKRFKEIVLHKQREIQSIHSQNLNPVKYNVIYSSEFFTGDSDYTITPDKQAVVPYDISFNPIKSGEYPCKVILKSDYDTRVYMLKGIGLPRTKTVEISIQTVTGKLVKQTIPFSNPSEKSWEFKVQLLGSPYFKCPNRFIVDPEQTHNFIVEFMSKTKGDFINTITVTNITKEVTTIYSLNAHVDDPPAVDKLVLHCKAREKSTQRILVFPFLKDVTASVHTNIPIIEAPNVLSFPREDKPVPFEFDVYASESGVSAGTITFTDPETKLYQWYILEIHVSPPEPVSTINVSTVARSPASIRIPIRNPHNEPVKFLVEFNDETLIGPNDISVPANETIDYNLMFRPLTVFRRMASVSFINNATGEFHFLLDLESTEPGPLQLSVLHVPIGKIGSAHVVVENMLNKKTNFIVNNSNQLCFRVLCPELVSIDANDKLRVEITYAPSSIGTVEESLISFSSKEAGVFVFKALGMGKPPQPFSPLILTGTSNSASSANILFQNPFSYPMKFSFNITKTETSNVFAMLIKKNHFMLKNFSETAEIPLSFTPPSPGQYRTTVIISSQNGITWSQPVIGIVPGSNVSLVPILQGKANTVSELKLDLRLIGEKEEFDITDYIITPVYKEGFEWLNNIIYYLDRKIIHEKDSPRLTMLLKIHPKRPIETVLQLVIVNPMSQHWVFDIDIHIGVGDIEGEIHLETVLNVATSAKVYINQELPDKTPFHAYLVSGSASEFTISKSEGFIETELSTNSKVISHLPFEIIFTPRIYGKVMKALLVVDTLEQQFLWSVYGTIPRYVPPPKVQVKHRRPTAETIRNWNSRNSARRREIQRPKTSQKNAIL